MKIKTINIITLLTRRIEAYTFEKVGSNIKLVSFLSSEIKDILELQESELEFLLHIQDKAKLTIIVDCSYEALKNVFVFPKNTVDMQKKLLNNFKEKYDINLSDYYIDFIFNNFNDEVVSYACGCPKKYIDTLGKFLTRHNFKLLALETDIDAFNRIALHDKTVLKILVLDEDILIIVSNQGKIMLERLVTFGYNNILSHFANLGGMEFSQAKALFEQKGFFETSSDDEQEQNIRDAIIDSLDKVGIEAQKSIDLFLRHFRGQDIDKIIISGKILNVPKIDVYFSKLFNIESQKLNVLQNISTNEQMENIYDEAKVLDIAVGAALRSSF